MNTATFSDPLDFSGKTVLVVGGSSGIGNGIAQGFRGRGASVHVWGTRASAAHYQDEEGSDLQGLVFSQVDVADPAAVAAAGTPQEMADACLFLASPMASYIYGQTLLVDGGRTL